MHSVHGLIDLTIFLITNPAIYATTLQLNSLSSGGTPGMVVITSVGGVRDSRVVSSCTVEFVFDGGGLMWHNRCRYARLCDRI